MGKKKSWKRVWNSQNRVTWSNNKRTWIRVDNEKALFPTSGRGWTVNKMLMPTMKRGSQSTLLGRFETRFEAIKFAKQYMKKHPVR